MKSGCCGLALRPSAALGPGSAEVQVIYGGVDGVEMGPTRGVQRRFDLGPILYFCRPHQDRNIQRED
jgi:hypothetical protein